MACGQYFNVYKCFAYVFYKILILCYYMIHSYCRPGFIYFSSTSVLLNVCHLMAWQNCGRKSCKFDVWPSKHIQESFPVILFSSLASARQHPSYADCLEVKREYYQNCSVLDCVTQCSQYAAHLCEQFLQVKQIGFVKLGPLRCA